MKLSVAGHTWSDNGWGYVTTETPEEFLAAYVELTDVIATLKSQGLAAAIYTQTTDVEVEANGLLTYDRAVFKIDPQRLTEIHGAFFA